MDQRGPVGNILSSYRYSLNVLTRRTVSKYFPTAQSFHRHLSSRKGSSQVSPSSEWHFPDFAAPQQWRQTKYKMITPVMLLKTVKVGGLTHQSVTVKWGWKTEKSRMFLIYFLISTGVKTVVYQKLAQNPTLSFRSDVVKLIPPGSY